MKTNFKYIVFLAITMIFLAIGCTDEAGEVVKGEKCSYYSDCKSDEICLKEECVVADSYDCTKENDVCPKDLSCSHVSGKCKPVGCSKHSECSDGQFCDGNVCKTGCVSHVECGDNYECNIGTGECDLKSDVNCVTNPEMCTEFEICNIETKQCVSKEDDGCASDWECNVDAGEICKTNADAPNECIMDPNRCETVADCLNETDYKCNSQHKCELTIRIDCTVETQEADCGAELCDPSDNKCVQCYRDSDCTGSACGEDRMCIVTRTCTDDGQCPTGTKCVMADGMMPGTGGLPGQSSEGTCKEVDVCYLDADCNPEGTAEGDIRYCKIEDGETEGYCATENNFDQDDLTSGFLDSLGICLDIPGVDFLKCPEGQTCENNKCSGGGGGSCDDALGIGAAQCTENGGTCVDGVCQGEREAECSNDGDCATLYPERDNQICQRGGCMEDPTPRCPNGDSDCQTEAMHMYCDSGENICYSCVTDAHCDGATCRDHNCVNSSFCSSDGDCNGGRCVANVCE